MVVVVFGSKYVSIEKRNAKEKVVVVAVVLVQSKLESLFRSNK